MKLRALKLVRSSSLAIFTVLLPFVGEAQVHSDPAFWGSLEKGRFAVGFRSEWHYDHSRSYDITYGDGSSYSEGDSDVVRPILVNVWYPARVPESSAPMSHGDYLDIEPSDQEDTRLTKFAEELKRFALSVMEQETIFPEEGELSAEERSTFEGLLSTATAAFRGAEPVNDTRLPLVVYHAGHGSSFEDNAVLCEYLASHGFVVIGSAYQSGTGGGFGVDSRFDSFRDIDFLVRIAGTFSNVDTRRIGLVGHSGGAHASLRYRSQPNSSVDAVVSLDTTQDYYSTFDPRWPGLVDDTLEGVENMRGPILMVANPHAFFQLADQFVFADRTYLTYKNLDHNDFISQGVQAAMITAEKKSAATEDLERSKEVRKSYESLCEYVQLYLSASLKFDVAARDRLKSLHTDSKLGGEDAHVVHVPVGQDKPLTHLDETDPEVSPSPRELRNTVVSQGGTVAARMIRSLGARDPNAPIFSSVFISSLLYELAHIGRNSDAKHVLDAYIEFKPNILKSMVSRATTWGRHIGAPKYALGVLRAVKAVDPDFPEVDELIEEFSRDGMDHWSL